VKAVEDNMPVADRINRIFGVLESAGYPKSLQKRLLPEWVTGEVLGDTAASAEIATILAQRLGLRTSLLLSVEPRVESLRSFDTRYKRSIPSRARDLTAATSVAVTIAEMAAISCQMPYRPFLEDPLTLREEIFAQHQGKWIGLRNLLLSCWDHGVPVVHLCQLGEGMPKMDGMVVFTHGRPVILLSKNTESWAWQLFILSHEVGHCALGHVSPGEILVDEQLGDQSYALTDSDLDEQAADSFAIAMLNGRHGATYTASDTTLNAADLANAAVFHGGINKVDPGHIILNFGHHNKAWPLAMKALTFLDAKQPPASSVINEALWRYIQHDQLPPDNIDLLEKLTGRIGVLG